MFAKAAKRHMEAYIARRLMIPTLIALYLLSFVAGSLSLAYAEKNNQKRLYNQFYNELQKMQYSINVYLEDMVSIASSLRINSDIELFFKYPELSEHQKEKIAATANAAINMSPAIHSIYITSSRLDYFMYIGKSSLKLLKNAGFYDNAVFAELQAGQLPVRKISIRKVYNQETDHQTELISVFGHNGYLDRNGPLTAIVVNMRTSFLYNIIESGLDCDNVTVIVDKNGMILTENEEFAQYSLLSDYGIDMSELEAKHDFVKYDNGKRYRYYIASTEADIFGNRLLSLVPSSYIAKVLLPGRITAIAIFLLAIIIVSLMCMFLNQLARKPITELVLRTNKIERELAGDGKAQMMQVLRSVMTHGRIYPEEKRKEMVRSISLPFEAGDRAFLMEVLIHNYLGLISEKTNREYEELILRAGNIIEDIMSADSKCMVVNRIANGSYYIIASPYGNAEERLDDIISNAIDSITSTLPEALGIKVVILYSTRTVDIHDLYLLVEKTEKAAANRPFFSPGTIIDVDRFRMDDYTELYRKVFQKINRYSLAMQAEDFGNADRLCEEIFDVRNTAEMRLAWSVMTMTTLPMICSSYPDQVSFEITEMLNDEKTIGKLSSPEEMKSWVIECHQRLCEKIRLHKSERNCDLVTQVNKIVQCNYSDPELNVAYIADKIGVSPNYLSSSYRKLTSTKLTEYIQDVRMAMARDKLINTDMLVSSIARACGYKYNVGYFQQLFKRKHGLTPTQYRDKMRAMDNLPI